MIFCFRKACMHRSYLVFFLVFILITWWIYSNFLKSKLRDYKWNPREEDKITKLEKVSNDIKKIENYQVDIRHVRASLKRKQIEGLHQTYEDDQIYVKNRKEKVQSKKMGSILNDIEENETYPIDIRYIPILIQRKLNKGLLHTYENDQKYLKELKEMLLGNELTRSIKFEDDFLRSYITSNDYKIDRAFAKLDNFLNLSRDHDYFFHNMSFDFTQNPAYRFVTVLPHRRKDGSATILFELAKWDPDEVPLEHLKKIWFMIYVQSLRNPVTQASGLNIIYDFLDVGFKILKYGTPNNLLLIKHVSLESLPAKYLGYHLVNVNTVGNILVMMSRPFLSESFEKILHTHSSVKELHDFFPTSMLPVQYGGKLTDYYAADWIRKANQEHGNFPAGGQKNVF